MQDSPPQISLWQQLQGAADLLIAVRQGRSMTAALERVPGPQRPGVQAIASHVLRCLGRAEALRQQLVSRSPPPEADALLCVALACMTPAQVARDGVPNVAKAEEALMYAPHTLVDQAVEAAKRREATQHQASFINGCLRRFLRDVPALMAATESKPQAVWNHPQWWIDRLRKDHPAHWQDILRANNSRAPLILRINEQKVSQAQYLRALGAINIEAYAVGKCGVVLAQAHAVPSLPGFKEGHFSVQDAAAQLAAPLLLEALSWSATATPSHVGPRILDACAAPGGKTAHLLELGASEVVALDIDAERCERVAQNLLRLGLQAHIKVGDAGIPEGWWDGRPFDGILLDAPCTASGIVRRHPDVRWLRRPTDIAQLAAVQARLLQALWPLLRPGGVMLYCTCSVFRDEGENQMQTFVAHHTDTRLRPSPGHLLPQSRGEGALFPDNLMREHDGFYYAVLEKEHA